ncbi:unnamed protein product [Ectocarpus sp. CCAP 1310/34]|nr:unnamed protein product [Ectocarpus sp. CCAP 1310/34]
MAAPPTEPDDAQVPPPTRPTTTGENRTDDGVAKSSSAGEGTTIEREELRKLLFVKVEEELARRQATGAAAEAAATAATAAAAAAAAAVPVTESPLQVPEPFVPSTPLSPLAPLQPYYYCDPLLNRWAHFAMDCGFYAGVAPVLLQHIVSTVYGAEFASRVATLSTADVDYMFDVFWINVVCSFSREYIFFRMATRLRNGSMTRVRGTVKRHKANYGKSAGSSDCESGDFGWHIYGLTTGGADTTWLCFTECHGPSPDFSTNLFHGQWVSFPPAVTMFA